MIKGIGHSQHLQRSNQARKHRQQSFIAAHWRHELQHGGQLRNYRRGRGARPLSTKLPVHVVFKVNKGVLRAGSLRSHQVFSKTIQILKKYAHLFSVKIEQLSVQNDHIHLLIRVPKRAQFKSFFRVVPGQMAQQFRAAHLYRGLCVTDTPKGGWSKLMANSKSNSDTALSGAGDALQNRPACRTSYLWRFRPFTRVVRGYRAYKIVRDYIQLNEKEARGEIVYRKTRLRGMSSAEWRILWS